MYTFLEGREMALSSGSAARLAIIAAVHVRVCGDGMFEPSPAEDYPLPAAVLARDCFSKSVWH